ncbi:hypothetical protein [Nocardia sp. NPDC052566]|uniref:hypothetical protein n=1 Tax=Nocardia sp. NPDC052566 TaxID=3364330 RepID=UPI0037C592CB
MSKQFDENEMAQFAQRWVAQWSESDPELRAKLIREIWADDGVQVLVDPPLEIREAAAALSFTVPSLEVRGHAALLARVARAYEMFIEPGEYAFEAAGAPTQLPAGLIGLAWNMVSKADGTVAGGGYDVFGLAADGRIQLDYQFIEGVR